jgi:hypothetical protein
MHLVVLCPLDANTSYQYGGHIVNMERKQMKCGYPKILYHQRNIISVIKRLFGEHFYIKVSKNAE